MKIGSPEYNQRFKEFCDQEPPPPKNYGMGGMMGRRIRLRDKFIEHLKETGEFEEGLYDPQDTPFNREFADYLDEKLGGADEPIPRKTPYSKWEWYAEQRQEFEKIYQERHGSDKS